MNRSVAAFYVVLCSCAFALSIFVSRSVGNIIVLLSFGILFIEIICSNNRLQSRPFHNITIPFRASSSLLYSVTALWGLFIIGFVRNPSLDAFFRLGAFTILSAITLFVVPAVVPREHAFRAIATFGAVSVAIALPSLIWPDYTVFGIKIAQVLNGTRGELTLGVISRTPTSFFDGISYFRVLTTIGTVCAGGLFAQERNIWMGIACVLNLFGIFLGAGYATILGLFAAVVLAVVYRVAGRRALAGITGLGMLVAGISIAIAFGVLPGPEAMLQSILGKRVGYWMAAMRAVAERPILGWGVADTTAIVSGFYPPGSLTGVHNSYLRIFVVGGIIGGIAYLVLSGSALGLAFRAIGENVSLGLVAYCLVATVLVIQMFTGGTIFGTNLSSVLWALAIGYAQPGVATVGDGTTLLK